MSTYRIPNLFVLILFACFLSSPTNAQQEADKPLSTAQIDDEQAVKDFIVEFLVALGNDDKEALSGMFLPNANMGSIRVKDGKTSIFTSSVEEWLAGRALKENKIFEEPVQEFTVELTQGRLAFVRANTTLLYDGVPNHYAHDFFVLMKEEGQWKILSGSYTTLPLGKG